MALEGVQSAKHHVNDRIVNNKKIPQIWKWSVWKRPVAFYSRVGTKKVAPLIECYTEK
jgi:hypothetical protein